MSADKILHSGKYSDLTITAEGRSHLFHKPIVCGKSAILAEGLDDEKTTEIALKCSYQTLTFIHDLFYNINSIDEKTSILEIWDVYVFMHQYVIDPVLITKELLEKINTVEPTELIELALRLEKVNYGKEILTVVINRMVQLLKLAERNKKFCTGVTIGCCVHSTKCKTEHCCEHRNVLSRDAGQHKLEMHAAFMAAIEVLSLNTRTLISLKMWLDY